ncbi:MAG: hypothetical protein DSY77_02075 [Bacteroidetes bacterium]|nr:MAG: hypothetical protein DSY77_02075 [Bacteroidota bacterium]
MKMMNNLILHNVDDAALKFLKDASKKYSFEIGTVQNLYPDSSDYYEINGIKIKKEKKDFSNLDLVSDVVSEYKSTAKELREKGWNRNL